MFSDSKAASPQEQKTRLRSPSIKPPLPSQPSCQKNTKEASKQAQAGQWDPWSSMMEQCAKWATRKRTSIVEFDFDAVDAENTQENTNGAEGDAAPQERNDEAAHFEIVSWSSQKNSTTHAATNLALRTESVEGRRWTTIGPPEQWLIIDFGEDVALSTMKFHMTATIGDPKDVSIQLSDEIEGPWVPLKRMCVRGGPRLKQKLQSLPLGKAPPARYVKLLFYANYGSASFMTMLAPIEFRVDPTRMRVNKEVRKGLANMVTHFCEANVLTTEDRKFRDFTRAHQINLVHGEEIRAQFERYDYDKSGAIEYNEFCQCLKNLLEQRELSEHRCQHFWREVNPSGSGKVGLEDYVLWFYKMFYSEGDSPRSKHNPAHRSSTAERFYAQYGTRRLSVNQDQPVPRDSHYHSNHFDDGGLD